MRLFRYFVALTCRIYLTVYFLVLFEPNNYILLFVLLMRSVEFYGKLSIVHNSLKINDFDV